MLNWAITFLIVAIVAGLLGFSGIAGAATQIAWILFVVGLVVALVSFVTTALEVPGFRVPSFSRAFLHGVGISRY
jgi:uncharacterized membrane protein YtjA (UPF0391 family)